MKLNAEAKENIETIIAPVINTGFLPYVSLNFPAIKAPIKNPMNTAEPVNPFSEFDSVQMSPKFFIIKERIEFVVW